MDDWQGLVYIYPYIRVLHINSTGRKIIQTLLRYNTSDISLGGFSASSSFRIGIILSAMAQPTAAQKATEYFRSLRPDPPMLGGATEPYKERDALAYALSRVPMLTPRPVKIIAAGAGFGGIALARAIQVGQIPGATLTVYEKDAGIGGTWWENRYPGYVQSYRII
jgi:hypothetical protein